MLHQYSIVRETEGADVELPTVSLLGTATVYYTLLYYAILYYTELHYYYATLHYATNALHYDSALRCGTAKRLTRSPVSVLTAT